MADRNVRNSKKGSTVEAAKQHPRNIHDRQTKGAHTKRYRKKERSQALAENEPAVFTTTTEDIGERYWANGSPVSPPTPRSRQTESVDSVAAFLLDPLTNADDDWDSGYDSQAGALARYSTCKSCSLPCFAFWLSPWCPHGCCSSRKVTIPVRAKSMLYLFNTLDPSPFYRKDLDSDFVDYVLETAEDEHRLSRSMELQITLTHPSMFMERFGVHAARNAIVQHFRRMLQNEERRLAHTFEEALIFLFTTVIIFSISLGVYSWSQTLSNATWKTFIGTAAQVVAWVSVWRPTEVLLYQWRPIRAKRNVLRQLTKMEVVVFLPGGKKLHSTGKEDPALEV